MRFFNIPYPNFHPVALSIGPIAIHWYGIAYVCGILVGYHLAKAVSKLLDIQLNLSDLASNIVLGIIIGGRLGYVLFYDPSYYLNHPTEIIAIWNGGMAFHGGAIGAFAATILTCKKHGASIHKGLDLLAICATPGLFFGRIANFINGELYGRPTSVAWGMIFPTGGNMPRHPSQLYEATLEGLGLFLMLAIILKKTTNDGHLFSTFVIGYGMIRFFIEFTRAPDTHLGLLALNLSMGQYLSLAMIIFGLIWTYLRRGQYLK